MAAVTPAELGADIAARRSMDLPRELALADGTAVELLELLRLLPGKRAVFRACWQGRAVLAKWYLPAAEHQFQREHRGAQLLAASGLPTAELLGECAWSDGRLLLFRWLEGESLAALWAQGRWREALDRLAGVLERMRAAGLRQSDLHFDNFLVCPGVEGCAVIDAASVGPLPPGRRGRRQFRADLGLLAAQAERQRQPEICRFFERRLDEPKLRPCCERAWRGRRRRYLSKCFRDCTAIAVWHSWRYFTAVQRTAVGPDLKALLADPDATLQGAALLKDGGSSTVFRLVVDGRAVVVKRYNIKSPGHRLRRALQPTRAARSWRNSHHLQLLGYATAAPLALLEERWGPLRGRAWFVAEAVEGETLARAWQRRVPAAEEVEAVADWFRLAALEQLVHGDLKATNWLLDAAGRLFLIDLDAMRRVGVRRWWRRGDRADRRRFLRNWDGNAAARQALQQWLVPEEAQE